MNDENKDTYSIIPISPSKPRMEKKSNDFPNTTSPNTMPMKMSGSISRITIGLLGLIGMNIKNAIVLVDQIDTETAAGKAPREAVISATTTRIVPVAMASGTTILGMLPLLFDAMFGGMAATIMGGLLIASALTLFVLPVAYCAIHKIK